MCVYIYNVCVCVYIYIYNVCVCVFTYIMCVYVCLYIYLYIMCVYVCLYIYVHTHTQEPANALYSEADYSNPQPTSCFFTLFLVFLSH